MTKMKLLLIIAAVGWLRNVYSMSLQSEESCANIECRPGRECRVEFGSPECVCMDRCPDHFRPVCGSNHKSYNSHCLLHRDACLTGEHIHIVHKGLCKKQKEVTQAKSLLPVAPQDNVLGISSTPAICYSKQRDILRELILEQWTSTMTTEPWHVSGMTYRESLWGRFFTCDTDNDSYLVSDEIFACTKNIPFTLPRRGKDKELMRALCIDAIVDDGDTSFDVRLSFEEFTHIFDPKYNPKHKRCHLDGKHYEDGAEIHVACRRCICAAGSWVCTSHDCPKNEDPSDLQNFYDDILYDDDDDADEDDEIINEMKSKNKKSKKDNDDEEDLQELDEDDDFYNEDFSDSDEDEDEDEDEDTPIKSHEEWKKELERLLSKHHVKKHKRKDDFPKKFVYEPNKSKNGKGKWTPVIDHEDDLDDYEDETFFDDVTDEKPSKHSKHLKHTKSKKKWF